MGSRVPFFTRQREFTDAYKRQIVEPAALAASRQEVATLLRGEGLRRSHLSRWRRQFAVGRVWIVWSE